MSAPIIYAISDLHGNLPNIPRDAEILLLAGDICPDFRPQGAAGQGHYVDKGGMQQARWLDTTFRAWLETRPGDCEVVAIWGNHDFVGEHPSLVPTLPWKLLKDDLYDLGGLTIYGSPWVPGLPRWAFYGSEPFLEARADVIPDCDILMVHGPPYGAGDYIPGGTEKQASKYGNFEGIRVGDKALSAHLRGTDSPSIVVCGHIHEDRGEHEYHESVVHNVAAVDENCQLHAYPWTSIWI